MLNLRTIFNHACIPSVQASREEKNDKKFISSSIPCHNPFPLLEGHSFCWRAPLPSDVERGDVESYGEGEVEEGDQDTGPEPRQQVPYQTSLQYINDKD